MTKKPNSSIHALPQCPQKALHVRLPSTWHNFWFVRCTPPRGPKFFVGVASKFNAHICGISLHHTTPHQISLKLVHLRILQRMPQVSPLTPLMI